MASQSGIRLPYQYIEEFQPDTFEDVTKKNLEHLASSMGPVTRMRVLHGVVNGSTGAKVSGTVGWTPSKTGTGTYTIIFDAQFADAPTAMVTGVTGVANALATPSQVDITTFSVGGSVSDQSFSFRVEL